MTSVWSAQTDVCILQSLFHRGCVAVLQREVVDIQNTTLAAMEVVSILTCREYNQQMGGLFGQVAVYQRNVYLLPLAVAMYILCFGQRTIGYYAWICLPVREGAHVGVVHNQ